MNLNQLHDNKGARPSKTRLGRGIGSTKGKTAGRGHKGQKSRSGVSINGFEGGQMPIHRRLPKRGFNNIFKKCYVTLNLSDIQKYVKSKKISTKDTITTELLKSMGVIKNILDGVRILASGKDSYKEKLCFEVQGASKAAIEAIEKAGGTLTIKPLASKAAKEEKSKKKSSK